MATSPSISPPPPPISLPLLHVTAGGNLTFSHHHSAQIHARVLRLNLTSSSPASHLLHFHNSLIRSFTSLSFHSLSLSLFLSLLSSNLQPDEFTFPFVLKSSTHLNSLSLGQQLHTHLVKSNLLFTNVFCDSALLGLYVKIGSFDDAVKVFDRMHERSVATWNSMISGFVRNGRLEKGLEMLDLMESLGFEVGVSSWNSVIAGCVWLGEVELALNVLGKMVEDVRPNHATFNTLLPVISEISTLDLLKEFHGFAVRNVGVVDISPVDEERLWSAIAAGYACHRAMGCAMKLFERIKLKNSHLGNSMISGFLNCGQTDEAFSVFREMAAECIHEAKILSKVSLTLLLPECGVNTKTGLEIHAYAIRRGLESDTSVGNALMAMYSKREDKESVEKVFVRTIDKDVVSWNTIIASYVMTNEFDRAFELFQRISAEGLKPDEYSFSSILNGCGLSSYLQQGMALHGHMMKSGFSRSYPVVQNSLMDAYGKCGCVEEARRVFDEMEWSDSISWNTIISCYGFNDSPYETISLFEKMIEQGWKPNRITFIALLSACSHAGLLEEGLHYFETMEQVHGIVPDLDHYTCIVDTMGRLGQLQRAYKFIRDMPIVPDDCIWSALLSSCRIHGNIELAEIAAKNLIELEPRHSGYWVLLSNTYAKASRWKDVANVRAAMKDGGVKKSPGFSWIEVRGSELHRFFNADKLHEDCDSIYLALDGLSDQLKDEGYVPILNPST
ncbi:uncharacterized protein A4U43_C01F1320 [Asparagus officinalis]|uniref:Uncharacterized protein n=1 Tax=Asparagus officinalis TaxID=4686 RepID=A0A5P1FL51_ASPOF|nr:pentatricopeptide repeat-containing protein At4g21065-like [Asparagus officinalis]ONK78948.1 uncharacterized protein A4U43_C01F1320 [Asparagus officinalis]